MIETARFKTELSQAKSKNITLPTQEDIFSSTLEGEISQIQPSKKRRPLTGLIRLSNSKANLFMTKPKNILTSANIKNTTSDPSTILISKQHLQTDASEITDPERKLNIKMGNFQNQSSRNLSSKILGDTTRLPTQQHRITSAFEKTQSQSSVLYQNHKNTFLKKNKHADTLKVSNSVNEDSQKSEILQRESVNKNKAFINGFSDIYQRLDRLNKTYNPHPDFVRSGDGIDINQSEVNENSAVNNQTQKGSPSLGKLLSKTIDDRRTTVVKKQNNNYVDFGKTVSSGKNQELQIQFQIKPVKQFEFAQNPDKENALLFKCKASGHQDRKKSHKGKKGNSTQNEKEGSSFSRKPTFTQSKETEFKPCTIPITTINENRRSLKLQKYEYKPGEGNEKEQKRKYFFRYLGPMKKKSIHGSDKAKREILIDKLEHYAHDSMLRFKGKLKSENFLACVNIIAELLSFGMLLNSIPLLNKVMIYMSILYVKNNDYSFALLILQTCLKVSNQKCCLKDKPKILRAMADILNKGRKFNIAQKTARRALEYAWFNNDINEELECYELLGKLKYETANVDEANYYHEKAMKHKIEPTNAQVRKIAKKNIEHFQSKHPLVRTYEEPDLGWLLPVIRSSVREKVMEVVIGKPGKTNFKRTVGIVIGTSSKCGEDKVTFEEDNEEYQHKIADKVRAKKLYSKCFDNINMFQDFERFDQQFDNQEPIYYNYNAYNIVKRLYDDPDLKCCLKKPTIGKNALKKPIVNNSKEVHPLCKEKMSQAEAAGLISAKKRPRPFTAFDHKLPLDQLVDDMINEKCHTKDELWEDSKARAQHIHKYEKNPRTDMPSYGHKGMNDRLIQMSEKFFVTDNNVEDFYTELVKDCINIIEKITIDYSL